MLISDNGISTPSATLSMNGLTDNGDVSVLAVASLPLKTTHTPAISHRPKYPAAQPLPSYRDTIQSWANNLRDNGYNFNPVEGLGDCLLCGNSLMPDDITTITNWNNWYEFGVCGHCE